MKQRSGLATVGTSSVVRIPGPDGLGLQGRLRVPDQAPVGVAVIAHPHPAFGGNADVWLLPIIAERLAGSGWATVRVNFRGVGGSDGVQTGGVEEHHDLLATMKWLVRRFDTALPRAAVGWSFGAAMALRMGSAVDLWVGIAPPTRRLDAAVIEGPVVPDVLPPRRVVVVGSHDQFFPPESVSIIDPHEVAVIPDADHFLFDRDPEVAEAVAAALLTTAASR